MQGLLLGACQGRGTIHLEERVLALLLNAYKTSWQTVALSGWCSAEAPGTPGSPQSGQPFWLHGRQYTVRARAVTAGFRNDSAALMADCGLL